MLYKLSTADQRTTFVRLVPTSMQAQGLLELQMEKWLAENPTAVLPEEESKVLVISQQAPFKNVTDILAIDEGGNLVIIEVKRGQSPRDVIAQALEYASDVADWDYDRLNRMAVPYLAARGSKHESLLDAFCATFSMAPEDQSSVVFNRQQRIFVVAESIEEKLERTARWLLRRGVAISCLSYTCYLSNDDAREFFLDFNEVVRPVELRGGGSPTLARPTPPSEQEAVGRLPEDLRRVYESMREAALGFGQEVEAYATRNTLNFKGVRVFAEIPFVRKGTKLTVRVRPEGLRLAENESTVVEGIPVRRVPDSYLWTLNHLLEVGESSSIEAVIRLLRRSYEGGRRSLE